jgi:hypothetical protein
MKDQPYSRLLLGLDCESEREGTVKLEPAFLQHPVQKVEQTTMGENEDYTVR